MKDSYSFDIDDAGLEHSYEKHIGAYDRIFARCGLQFYRVESDSGFMVGPRPTSTWRPPEPAKTRGPLPGVRLRANVELARSIARAPQEPRDAQEPACGQREGILVARGSSKWPRPSSGPSRRCRRS